MPDPLHVGPLPLVLVCERPPDRVAGGRRSLPRRCPGRRPPGCPSRCSPVWPSARRISRRRRRTRLRTTAPPTRSAGRDAEPVLVKPVPADAHGHQRVATCCVHAPGAPRSRAAIAASRGSHPRASGRIASGGAASCGPLRAAGEHLAATLGLHPGAEAVLLGAMALLGLKRLLGHRWAWWLLWAGVDGWDGESRSSGRNGDAPGCVGAGHESMHAIRRGASTSGG